MKFAQLHGIKIATIADLIAYRRRKEKLIELAAETKINSSFGGPFSVKVFATKIDRNEHLAVIHGDLSGDEPVLVRMHQMNTLADMLGDTTPVHFFGEEPRARGGELEASMRLIIEKGRGVVVTFARLTAPASAAGCASAKAKRWSRSRSPASMVSARKSCSSSA